MEISLKKNKLTFKHILLTTTALTAGNYSVFAGDIPSSLKDTTAQVTYDWSGFYVGGTIGALGHTLSHDGETDNATGVIGGLHAGRNWQRDHLVYGLEGDVSAASGTTAIDGSSSGYSPNLLVTLRGRLGIAFDNNLIYATAGGAYLHGTSFSDDEFDTGSKKSWGTWGYTVGGGLERVVASHLIWRIEGNYLDFSDGLTYDDGDEDMSIKGMWSARTGLSYKF